MPTICAGTVRFPVGSYQSSTGLLRDITAGAAGADHRLASFRGRQNSYRLTLAPTRDREAAQGGEAGRGRHRDATLILWPTVMAARQGLQIGMAQWVWASAALHVRRPKGAMPCSPIQGYEL